MSKNLGQDIESRPRLKPGNPRIHVRIITTSANFLGRNVENKYYKDSNDGVLHFKVE
jgi:hypothetical protein